MAPGAPARRRSRARSSCRRRRSPGRRTPRLEGAEARGGRSLRVVTRDQLDLGPRVRRRRQRAQADAAAADHRHALSAPQSGAAQAVHGHRERLDQTRVGDGHVRGQRDQAARGQRSRRPCRRRAPGRSRSQSLLAAVVVAAAAGVARAAGTQRLDRDGASVRVTPAISWPSVARGAKGLASRAGPSRRCPRSGCARARRRRAAPGSCSSSPSLAPAHRAHAPQRSSGALPRRS